MLTMRPVIVGLGLLKTCAKVFPELVHGQLHCLLQMGIDSLANNAAHDTLVISQQEEAAATAEPNGSN